MASCDDDFSLLNDDHPHSSPNPNPNHHHHIPPSHHLHPPPYAPQQRYAPKSTPIHAQPQPSPPSPKKLASAPDVPDSGDDYADSAFHDVNPFSGDENSNPFATGGSDPTKSRADARSEKRRASHDELSDGGTPYSYKKTKNSGGVAGNAAGEYRKDREEWSDAAIACLLGAYTEKFTQLNRGNLRGRDWEEVASTVSERCDKQTKSVEQCKNKVDNLKKRYKLERHRMNNGGISASHWPWFKKLEEIVGNSLPMKSASAAAPEDDKAGGVGVGASVGVGVGVSVASPAGSARQSKR